MGMNELDVTNCEGKEVAGRMDDGYWGWWIMETVIIEDGD